jgi:DNA-binding Lrp family transcriptional regulator
MTGKLSEREEQVLKAMKEGKEYSCRALKKTAKVSAGECEKLLKKLITKEYVKRRTLSESEAKTYENGHTKFVYIKVIKE